MADITVTIPDGILTRVMDAIGAEYNYDANKLPGPPVETKGQFAKRQVIEFLKRTVKDHEGSLAAKQAREDTYADVDMDITLS